MIERNRDAGMELKKKKSNELWKSEGWIKKCLAGLCAWSCTWVVANLWHLGHLCWFVSVLLVALTLGDLLLVGLVFRGRRDENVLLYAVGMVVGFASMFTTLGLVVAISHELKASEVTWEGIAPANVTVKVSQDGVFEIESWSHDPFDVYFVQGLVMAQARTFQMEFQRSVSSGTIAELAGAAAIEKDKLFRTLGLHVHAQVTFEKIKKDPRFTDEVKTLERFADGVNAYFLNKELFHMPLELRILHMVTGQFSKSSLRPWQPSDTLGWNSVMAYGLSGNLQRELLRFSLVAQHGLSWDRVQELLPPFDVNAFPTILDAQDVCVDTTSDSSTCKLDARLDEWVSSLRSNKNEKKENTKKSRVDPALQDRVRMFRQNNAFGISGASNNWVAGGAKTASGKPILANDPHLDLTAPSVWCLFRLKNHVEDLELVGASLVGTPGIMLGRNNHVAWGVTNTGADVQDLFALEMNGNETHYLHGQQWFALEDRVEEIHVSGSNGGSVERMVVKEAPHYGPVLNNEMIGSILGMEKPFPFAQTLALRWTDLSKDHLDTTFASLWRVNRAKNWKEFRDALSLYVVPGQNFVFASESDIGYQFTGRIPRRKSGHNGLFPAPGNGTFDWEETFIPFEELPHVVNPKKGFIASANNRASPPCASVQVSCDWDSLDGYRAKRITQMVDRGNHTLESIVEMQSDVHSLLAQDMRIVLEHACATPRARASASANRVCQLLLVDWTDFEMQIGSYHASVFHHWFAILSQAPANETGHDYWSEPYFVRKAFGAALVPGEKGPVCSLSMTFEECADYAVDALSTVGDMASSIKSWGTAHFHDVSFTSQVFGETPFSCLFSRSVPHGGDYSTINVGSYSLPSFAQTDGPSYRQVVSFQSIQESVFMNGLGQHGSIFSHLYDNLLPLWADGLTIKM